MCSIPKFCLILYCTITIIKAVSLEIDGLINLGKNWSYEYRVLRSEAKHSLHQNSSEVGQQKDETQLRVLEERLRKEAAEHRKEVLQKDVEHTDKQHKEEKEKVPENVFIQNTVGTRTTKASDTSSSEISSSDSESEKQKKATAMIYDGDDTTKKTKKILRFLSKRDYSEPQSQESSYTSDSSERSASWRDKTRHAPGDEARASSRDSSINIINHYVNPRAPAGIPSKILEKFNKTMELFTNITKPKKSTPSQITTVRTEQIFTDPHKVKDDAKITEFTNHLYKQTLKVFDTVKQKTNQDHLKKQIDRLARSYEDKFKEYLRATSSQKIKTRLGTQKVILNTIDMSNRILRRLMNFMVGDLERKGVLRHNAASANIFQKAIETEQKVQLIRACKKFGICRTGQGFSAFLIDILTILLKCDDKKFKQGIDAFTEVVKNLDFDDVLERHTEKKLKKKIEKIEMQEDILILRAIVLILKNTIVNQNKPMVVHNYGARQRIVNSTLALLEIIDLLDTKIPRNESNILEWADMKNSFEEFAAGKRHDILEIMTVLVKHVMSNLESLDKKSKRIVSRNLDMILALELS